MFSLHEPAFFTRLHDARRILVAGAGGGFDVYAGLPLALALRSAGKEVHLANRGGPRPAVDAEPPEHRQRFRRGRRTRRLR